MGFLQDSPDSQDSRCLTLRRIADVLPLLESCPKTALDEFEAKINLAVRIARHQASLDLV